MDNEIRKVREETRRRLASAVARPEERFTERSPCGRYLLEVEAYAMAELPGAATLSVATIRSTAFGNLVASLHCNDGRCFHAWVTRGGRDYLLLAEDLEGQTVVDLTGGRVAGYSSPDDPFIWTEFHPSPDKSRLAVIGCYWACPFELVVYDFRDPGPAAAGRREVRPAGRRVHVRRVVVGRRLHPRRRRR